MEGSSLFNLAPGIISATAILVGAIAGLVQAWRASGRAYRTLERLWDYIEDHELKAHIPKAIQSQVLKILDREAGEEDEVD